MIHRSVLIIWNTGDQIEAVSMTSVHTANERAIEFIDGGGVAVTVVDMTAETSELL